MTERGRRLAEALREIINPNRLRTVHDIANAALAAPPDAGEAVAERDEEMQASAPPRMKYPNIIFEEGEEHFAAEVAHASERTELAALRQQLDETADCTYELYAAKQKLAAAEAELAQIKAEDADTLCAIDENNAADELGEALIERCRRLECIANRLSGKLVDAQAELAAAERRAEGLRSALEEITDPTRLRTTTEIAKAALAGAAVD